MKGVWIITCRHNSGANESSWAMANGVESWIIRNKEIYGQREEEQLAKLTTEVNEKIQDKCIN